MNLKESFHFQNKLKNLMSEAQLILSSNQNITTVKTTYLRKKVMESSEDEVRTEEHSTEYSGQITELVEFLLYLLSEYERLSAAICTAKASVPFDAGMDGEVGLNSKRQEIAALLRRMADLRNSETLVANGGTSYCFNQEGNQVPYRCDIKRVTTINFDRNMIRKMYSELCQKADKVSVGLDAALINIKVDYNAPFDANDSFANIFEDYVVHTSAA